MLALLTVHATAAGWSIPNPTNSAPPGEAVAAADPRSYPDAPGFQTRAKSVLTSLQNEDLAKWRRGYFSGGDPGKYLPGVAMAKLLLNPDDPEPGKYMNDDRSCQEQYHFAVVNWARFYPIFGERVLTPASRERFAKAMSNANYLSPGGTENHKTMWMTSANVLPAFAGAGTNHKSRDETLAEAKRGLRAYVKGLFQAGAGEWDSSTYLMFTVNGMLNVYDFSPDPECRLLARAALDRLIAGYALKYTDGVFCGPNQRGFYRHPHESISDQTGFVWWGSHAAASAEARDYRYALAPITSAWRPNRVLTHLARREISGLPVEQRNSKANYWYGQGLAPKAGAEHETVYIDRHYTMGSLWDAHGSQHTRFMIVAETPDGGAVFNGGHPRQSDHESRKTGIGFGDGTGRYAQSAQVGPTYVCMARVPDDDECDYAFFAYPTNLTPRTEGDWRVFDIGEARIAVRSLGAAPELSTTPADKKGHALPILKFPGRRCGFLVLVGETNALRKLPDVKLDVSHFADAMRVSYVVPDGRKVELAFNPAPEGDCHGDRAAAVSVDGKPIDLAGWPIYAGPLIEQHDEVLTVNDGKDGFVIDFTGDLPVYHAWTRK